MTSAMSRSAKIDPAHILDGLWVPRAGKGLALYEVRATHGSEVIKFEGVQLDVRHQSLLWAIAALTTRSDVGNCQLIGSGTNDRLLQKQLDLLGPKLLDPALAPSNKGADYAVVKCKIYAILRDAGLETNSEGYQEAIELLHQMSTVVMYVGVVGTKEAKKGRKAAAASEVKPKQQQYGYTSHLLSFQHGDPDLDGDIMITVNTRMTAALIGKQNIQVSLFERQALSQSPVAKILHSWLSNTIRLGGSLMAGRGASIDALIPHIWGNRPPRAAIYSVTMAQRRSQIKKALDLIGKLHGWVYVIEENHVFVSRPKELPWARKPPKTNRKADTSRLSGIGL